MNESMRFRNLSELGLNDPERLDRQIHTLFPKKATVIDYNPELPNIFGISIDKGTIGYLAPEFSQGFYSSKEM